MKTQYVMTGMMAALMLASGVAQAAGQGFGRGQDRVPFETLDTNGDGEVTQAEMRAHGQARFEVADTSGDGLLSQDELEAQAEEGYKRFVGILIARADANQDGMLSLQEMRNAVPRRQAAFEEMDTDGSGGLNRAEMAEGLQKFRNTRPGSAADQG